MRVLQQISYLARCRRAITSTARCLIERAIICPADLGGQPGFARALAAGLYIFRYIDSVDFVVTLPPFPFRTVSKMAKTRNTAPDWQQSEEIQKLDNVTWFGHCAI